MKCYDLNFTEVLDIMIQLDGKYVGDCMKKIFTILMVLVVLCSISINANAKDVTRVYSDVNTYKESFIEIPIKIENNDGLMGYKFSVKTTNLRLSEVVQNDFSAGIFNSVIADDKSSVEIIWTNSEAIKINGILFTIKAYVEDSKKQCEIDLVYSPTDTIDGEYNEVSLVCDLVTINPDNGDSQATIPNTSYENQEKEEIILQYINSVDSHDLKKVVVQIINESFLEIKIDINTEKDYTAQKLTAKLDDVPENNKENIINRFNKIISQKYNDLPAIRVNDGIEMIEEILECTEEYTVQSSSLPVINDEDETPTSSKDKSTLVNYESNNVSIILIVVIVIVIALVAIIIMILKGRWRKKT